MGNEVELFQRKLNRLLDGKTKIVLDPHETCPLKNECPFNEEGSPFPCEGTSSKRNTKFECDIYNLIKVWKCLR